MALVGVAVALLEGKNDLRITVAFYLPALGCLIALWALVRSGRLKAAGWALSLFFWGITAFVTLFFGGLKGQNAAGFAVSIMLIGSLVGGRAAIGLAALSSVWCALLAVLELRGLAPPQLQGYSPLNSWAAITTSLILMSVLLHASLASLKELHSRGLAAAAERDLALRRSIQSQKMELVGNVASGIAHDFNNLLMVISSATQLLRAELPAGRRQVAESLDDLDGATSRAAVMTRHLLTFGGSKLGEVEATDLGEFVRAFEPMLPRLLGSAIAISVDATPGLFVQASRSGLEQILLNLAVNARDAMPQGGTLKIRAAAEPATQGCTLWVEDSGIGMDEATQAHIFEPFFTTKPTGTGLGLSTLRELVTRFGAVTTVRSAPGKGTTFEIRFRAVPAPARSEAAPAPSVQPRNGSPRERVLVVEDDPMVHRATSRVLGLTGFEVVAVANGLEAVALLEKATDFVCVVSDLSMPLLDGEALAQRLATERPDLPVVLLSGNRAPPTPLMLSPHRASVEKPVSQQALLAAIVAARGPH